MPSVASHPKKSFIPELAFFSPKSVHGNCPGPAESVYLKGLGGQVAETNGEFMAFKSEPEMLAISSKIDDLRHKTVTELQNRYLEVFPRDLPIQSQAVPDPADCLAAASARRRGPVGEGARASPQPGAGCRPSAASAVSLATGYGGGARPASGLPPATAGHRFDANVSGPECQRSGLREGLRV